MSHNPEMVLRRLQARANAMRHEETLRAADDLAPAPRPRPELARHVDFLVVRNHHPIELVAAEASISPLMLHRVDGKSEVCTEGIRYCYGCILRQRPRWTGYLGAVVRSTRKPVILTLTPAAYLSLTGGGPQSGGLFRRRITVARTFNSIRSRLWATLGERDDCIMLPYLPTTSIVLTRRFNIDPTELELLHFASSARILDKGGPEGDD